MMIISRKLIVINPNNEQQIIEIDQSGSYYDSNKIIWDEKVDGPITDIMIEKLGALYRENDELFVDPTLEAGLEAAREAKEAAALEAQRLENIRNEYPSFESTLEAFVQKEEGDATAWNAVLAARLEVRKKYPSP